MAIQDINEAKLEEFIGQVQGHLVGAATMAMAYLGDQLGLYRNLAQEGPATAHELAERTGCGERYLREWLTQQAAIGYLTCDSTIERFSLPPEHAMVLAVEASPTAFGGVIEANTGWYQDLDQLGAAFRSSDGIPWGDHDSRVHTGVARFFGAAYRASLVDEWVPALGLDPVLRRGARVADVGCGHGASTILLARAYPASEFVGFDAHGASIEAARRRAEQAGIANRVRFEVARADDFGGGPYDVIWFFDCFHDLGNPVAAAAHARDQLSDDGMVALVEPFAYDQTHENLVQNHMAGLHYTASTLVCVPHSFSEPGRAALGSQAGGQVLAETLRKGHLTHAQRVSATPQHAVYAARP